MGFEQVDEACQAGARAENADFATPTGNAGINPLKIARRNIYVPFSLNLDGIVGSGGFSANPLGVFPGVILQNAATGYIITSAFSPRGEISPGEKGFLNIMWGSAGTSGDVRFVADIKPAIQNTANLAAAVSRNVIQAANTSANALSVARMEFPPAIFNNNQIWGLKLSRDPANSLDTLASDITVHAIWMEILGRC